MTVTGSGFTGATQVLFGKTAATSYTVQSDTTLTAVSPAAAKAGVVDVKVTTPAGTSAATAADKFTYAAPAPPSVTGLSPSSGPISGGTTVTISGTGFTGATQVLFGKTAAASFTVNSATSITAVSPAVTRAGVVDVKVTNPAGTSVVGSPDSFTYVAASPPTSPASRRPAVPSAVAPPSPSRAPPVTPRWTAPRPVPPETGTGSTPARRPRRSGSTTR